MNISGYFSKHEISEELIIPFASSKPAILMVAGSDDQLCPSVYFVSTVQFFLESHKNLKTYFTLECRIDVGLQLIISNHFKESTETYLS